MPSGTLVYSGLTIQYYDTEECIRLPRTFNQMHHKIDFLNGAQNVKNISNGKITNPRTQPQAQPNPKPADTLHTIRTTQMILLLHINFQIFKQPTLEYGIIY